MEHMLNIAAEFCRDWSVPALVMSSAASAGLAAWRVGALRAVSLGLSSHYRLFMPTHPASQRKAEVDALRRALSRKSWLYEYIVVAGPPGVGKTSVVETATKKIFGVVTVHVSTTTPKDEILSDVLGSITHRNPDFANEQTRRARRVLSFHRFFFRRPVTVVLGLYHSHCDRVPSSRRLAPQAPSREFKEKYVDLDSAARALVQDYGVHVVVDAPDSSLLESFQRFKDEISVPPMPRAILEEVPELTELHAALKAADLADIVWACVGGVPARYVQLSNKWSLQRELDPSAALAPVVERFLQDAVLSAIGTRSNSVIANDRLKALYALFREHREVPFAVLQEKDIQRPFPDRVLRAVTKTLPSGEEELVLVPEDAVMAVVLRCALDGAPCLQPLKEHLCSAGLLTSIEQQETVDCAGPLTITEGAPTVGQLGEPQSQPAQRA